MIIPPPGPHDPVDLACCPHARAAHLEEAAREARDAARAAIRRAYEARWRPWRIAVLALVALGCAAPVEAPAEPEHTVWAQGLLSPEGGWLGVEIDAMRVHLSCPSGATSTRRILEIEITGNEFTTRPGRVPLALPCEAQVFAPWPVTVEGAQIRRLTETTIVIERVELGRTYEMRRLR